MIATSEGRSPSNVKSLQTGTNFGGVLLVQPKQLGSISASVISLWLHQFLLDRLLRCRYRKE